jgi:hypothetical protein
MSITKMANMIVCVYVCACAWCLWGGYVCVCVCALWCVFVLCVVVCVHLIPMYLKNGVHNLLEI